MEFRGLRVESQVKSVALGITTYSGQDDLVASVAADFAAAIRSRPAGLVCLPTGPLSMAVYRKVAELERSWVPSSRDQFASAPFGFPDTPFVSISERLHATSLTGPLTRDVLLESFFGPLSIDPSHLVSFPTNPASTIEECRRMDDHLDACGPAHLFFVEIDAEGRIGLVEGGTSLRSRSHVSYRIEQSDASRSLFGKPLPIPYGLTIGLQDVSDADLCLAVAAGTEAGTAIREALGGLVSETYPCAALRFCRNCHLAVDEAAASAIGSDLLRRFGRNAGEDATADLPPPFQA
jgi:glucosamine-6-phosphate deaminase